MRKMRKMRKMRRRMRRIKGNEDEEDEEDEDEDQENKEEDEENEEGRGKMKRIRTTKRIRSWLTGCLVKKGLGRVWTKSDRSVITLWKKSYHFRRRGWLAGRTCRLACYGRLANGWLAASGWLANRLASRRSFLSMVLANIKIFVDQYQ